MDQDFDQAMQRAVRYLARRDRTEAELMAWLTGRGVDETIAARVCDRCRQSGWLSDERVAQRTVEVSAKRRYLGKLRVEQEMEQRQVAPEAKARALEQLSSEGELERAVEALEAHRTKFRTPQSAARWLASRGYEEEVVMQAVERALGPLEPE